MPWLVGVVADVLDLRWGLAIAAFTPLLMYLTNSLSLFFCVSSCFSSQASMCILYEKAQTTCSCPHN